MRATRFLLPVLSVLTSLLLAGCGIDSPAQAATDSPHAAAGVSSQNAADQNLAKNSSADSPPSDIHFVRYDILDPRMNGMIAATLAVPQGWKTQSSIDWDMNNGNNPTRGHSRFEAPDHSAWVENFPIEIFSWLSVNTRQQNGARTFGLIHYPNITIEEAMRRFVIGTYRGSKKNLQIVGAKAIPNLAQSMAHQQAKGDSLLVRIRYEENGEAVDEDFYGFLGAQENIPSDSPVGRMWEYHRGLFLVHSMGARHGTLENVYPVLNHIVASAIPNPAWQNARKNVITQIMQNFNRNAANNYAQIAAAGQRSKAISRQNDAMVNAMDANRMASNARSAAAASPSSGGDGFTFDDYVRGTERMNDPSSSTGQSAHSYNDTYHWSDGNGHYQNTSDPSFNPNVGSNQNWTQLSGVGQH